MKLHYVDTLRRKPSQCYFLHIGPFNQFYSHRPQQVQSREQNHLIEKSSQLRKIFKRLRIESVVIVRRWPKCRLSRSHPTTVSWTVGQYKQSWKNLSGHFLLGYQTGDLQASQYKRVHGYRMVACNFGNQLNLALFWWQRPRVQAIRLESTATQVAL